MQGKESPEDTTIQPTQVARISKAFLLRLFDPLSFLSRCLPTAWIAETEGTEALP